MSNIKSILIVEDDKAISKVMAQKLGKLDFKIKTAANGQEALQILEQEEFDLILLDLIMPRMDGMSALKKFKEKGIKSKIIIISNLGQAEDIEKAKALGADDYFIKAEITLSEIADKIKSL